jgi:hypothetical protein
VGDFLSQARQSINKLASKLASSANNLGGLDRDVLLSRITEGILALQRRGSRGRQEFPAGVLIQIQLGEGSIETIHQFLRSDSFERDLEARILNKLTDPGELPVRRYEVSKVEAPTSLQVLEDADAVLAVAVITGGDKAGERILLDVHRKEWRIGRGPIHRAEAGKQASNDIVLTLEEKLVSRAAALLKREGARLVIYPKDQGEFLRVRRANGVVLCPARTADKSAAVKAGDCIEFFDEKSGLISLKLEAPCL